MSKQLLFSASVLALCVGAIAAPTPASALDFPWAPVRGEVAASCAVPAAMPTGKTWYVDPVKGTATGDGSEARPWNSLSTLIMQGYISTMPNYWDGKKTVKVMTNAPIHPGDLILLKSGNYGKITIHGDFSQPILGFDNSDFITIQAAPGATPVLDQLYLIGGGKWVFRGLTIENLRPALDAKSGPNGAAPLVEFITRHHDIILDNNTIGAKFPVTGWTEAQFLKNWSQSDWLTQAPSGILDYSSNNATCVTITNNTIKNVNTGLGTQRSNHVLIKGNTIDYIAHDGMDYASSNLVIQHNLLTNRLDAGDPTIVHPDFMQGQAWGCTATGEKCDTLNNVLIDGNIAIRQTDPNLPFTALSTDAGATQGIDTFDGIWNNIRVTNNVVVTSAYQGISFYGVHGAVIANNTLLSDDKNSQTFVPWITVQNQKNGTVSSDVVIRNNIANMLTVSPTTTNLAVDHNLIISTTSGTHTLAIVLPGHSTVSYVAKPGVYGDNNTISTLKAGEIFKTYDSALHLFDLHLKAETSAIGKGNATEAPTIDILGNKRKAPFDLGAYAYTTPVAGSTTK